MTKTIGEKTLESMNQAVWYNQWLLKRISKYLTGEILEIGCGIGNFTKLLTKFGKITAIDIEKSYLEKTKNVIDVEEASVGLGDIEKGKFFFQKQNTVGKKFDSIISINVFEHIKNDELAFKNCYKLLKPKGYLILVLPGHNWLYGKIDQSIDHYRRYNQKMILSQLKINKFKLISMKQFNFLGAIGWFISGKIFNNTSVSKSKVMLFNIFGPIFLFLERFIKIPFGISFLIIARKA